MHAGRNHQRKMNRQALCTEVLEPRTLLSTTLAAINYPPQLVPIPALTVGRTDLVAFRASAKDLNLPGDTITYSLLNAPTGAQINPTTGAFSWQINEDWTPGGGHTVAFTVRATDAAGLFDEQEVQVSIAMPNTPPAIQRIAPITAAQGSTVSFHVDVVDPDYPQVLTLSLQNAPAGATLDPATRDFNWAISESQAPDIYVMTLVANDGYDTGTRLFQITVIEPGTAPVIAPIADQTIAEGTALSFTASASSSSGQSLMYALAAGAPAGAAINPTTGLFTWTPSETQGPGTYTITLTASDGTNIGTRDFRVSVTEQNAAPILTNTSVSVPENQPAGTPVTTITATDGDLPANALSYAITGGNEDGHFTIDPATGKITLVTALDYEARSTYALTITATDTGSPALSTSATVTINVADLKEFGLQQGKLQRATLTDSDGDLVTFSLTGGGSGTIQPDGRIVLTGTTPKSALSISVRKSTTGDGSYTLSGITSAGPLKGLSAAKVFATGDITLNTAAPGSSPVAISLAGITDANLVTRGQPLSSLKLQSWRDTDPTPDQLLAPWIGSIAASGDWQADILTNSSNRGIALSSLKVGGSINQANLWAAGILKSLSAKGGISSSNIAAADGLAALSAARLADSNILVGASQNLTGHFANPAAKLNKLTITGQKLPKGQLHPAYVTNSQIYASTYGSVTLTNVPAGTAPILHVATDTGTLKLVSLAPAAPVCLPGTWRATQTPKPGHERPNLVEVVA